MGWKLCKKLGGPLEPGRPEEGWRKTEQIPIGKNAIDAPLIGR